jgi:hypothetical protein
MNETKNQYPWAVNQDKLARAIIQLKAEGAELTDENVKTRYKKFLGLAREEVEKAVEENVERRKPKKPKVVKKDNK